MPYNNGSRYNRQLKQRQPKRNVWRREDSASAATKENADATTSTSTAAATGATDAGNGRTFKLSAEAKPFVKKLNAKAEPFVSRKRLTSDRLEEIERKKRELQEKIRAKKRKIEEDERFRKKQKALRDAAKHSQQVAEQKAKIARLQGGFMKVKKHMIDTKQVEGEATTTDLLGRASQSNLKPTNKMKEVTKEDVVRVLQAMNDYEVLQVNLASGSSEIRKNFLKLSRAFHPDKCKVEGSKEAFQRVSKAYTNLKKQYS